MPNQAVVTTLTDQQCQINVYQRGQFLFLDLYLNNAILLYGVICENLNRIIRDTYFGFSGDLCWLDTQGESDPIYTGIGSRFHLCYLSEAELATGVAVVG